MSLKTFGRTITGSALAADGTRLLLQHPQTMAKCTSQVVPYQMPHEDGGFLILAEYGDPCPPCKPPKPKTVGGCPTSCPSTQSACPEPKDPMEGELLRYEIVEYSGYDTDGQTLLITTRGAEGTIKQEWGENTLVMQMPTGAELGAIIKKIEDVECFLKKLGCIMSVPHAEACKAVKAGEFVCHNGCWRKAKKDLVIAENEDGTPNIPASENADWGPCVGIESLLALTDLAGIKQACTNADLTGAMRAVTGDQIGKGLWWNPETCKIEAIASSIPTGCKQYVSGVVGSFKTDLGSDTPIVSTPTNDYFAAHPPGQLEFKVADYPYLGVAGRKICQKFDSNMHYAVADPNHEDPNNGQGVNIQTGIIVNLNGDNLLPGGDGYYLNTDGSHNEAGTTNCVCFETTGEDLVFEVYRYFRTDKFELDGTTPIDYTGVAGYVDVVDIASVFSDGTAV